MLEEIKKTFRPPTKRKVSEWAEEERQLSPESSAEHGKWYNDRVPYLREIMDAVNDPAIETIVFKAASQVAKTEGIINNFVGYFIDQEPSPILLVLDSLDRGKSWSKDRLAPMLRDTPCLRNKVRNVKTRFSDNTLMHKAFPGGHITIVGANAPGALASRPIRIVLCDEINRYPASAGTEGDPVKLAFKRAVTFWNRKKVLTSSPTDENGAIDIWYNLSDKRKYYVPCPLCGKFQILSFAYMKWPKSVNEDGEKVHLTHEACYECPHCEGKIYNHDKYSMLAKGEWRATAPFKGIAGWHLGGLYSPWVSWMEIAEEFINSKHDRNLLKVFTNTTLGEIFKEVVESKSEVQILQNVVNIPPLICPKDTIALTCGIDPGQGGFWYSVLSWKWDMSCHLVHYGFLIGWDAVKNLIHENIYRIEGDDNPIKIWRLGIDTGGSKYENEDTTMTAAAYDFLRKYGGGKAFGTKGMKEIRSGRRLQHSIIDKMPGSKGEVIPGGLMIWIMDASAFKDTVMMRLEVKEGDPGRYTFHNQTGKDYVNHLLAEEKRRQANGQYEWERIRANNHWFDTTVIAYALADPEAWGGIQVLPKPNLKINRASESKRESQKDWVGTNQQKDWITGR